jgi:hypothetical protein
MKKSLAFIAIAGFLSTAPVGYTADPTAPGPTAPGVTLPRPQSIEGEVLRAEGNYYVVKDISGKEVRIYIDKNTKIDGNLTAGDKIIASTAAVPVEAPPYAKSIVALGSPRIVDGKIVAIEKDYYVIEDNQGRSRRVYVDSGTTREAKSRVGERVVVFTAPIPDAYADTITKR